MTMRPQGESRFLNVNNLRLHYLDWGNPQAPPIVALHGYTANCRVFNGMARHFRDRFHVMALDLRGHGDSEWSPEHVYGHQAYLSDLESAVDQLGLRRFALIGSSLGGNVSLLYVDKHPERIERLVVVDVGPELEPGYENPGAAMAAGPESWATLDEAVAYRRRLTPVLGRLSDDEQRSRGLHVFRHADGKWTWKLDPALYGSARPQAQPRPDFWPVWQRVSCPTMLVWGMESTMLGEVQARKIVGTLRDGRLVAVPGAGHPPLLNEPASLAALEDFLAPIAGRDISRGAQARS